MPYDVEATDQKKKMLGRRLKKYRSDRGWKLENVAAMSEISKGTISNYERGETAFTLEYLERLLKCYGVSLPEFLGVSENDLKVFQRYGLNERFFWELYLSENYMDSTLSDLINLLFGNPRYSNDVQRALNSFFDTANHDMVEKLPIELVGWDYHDTHRFLLEPVLRALIKIFETENIERRLSSDAEDNAKKM